MWEGTGRCTCREREGEHQQTFFGSFLEGGFQCLRTLTFDMQGRGDPRMVFTSTEHCFTLILTSVKLSLSFSEISLAPYTSLPTSFVCALLRKGGINVK